MLESDSFVTPEQEEEVTQTRVVRLRQITLLWERQLLQLEDIAYTHFRDQNLAKISELIANKRKLERRLHKVRAYLEQL